MRKLTRIACLVAPLVLAGFATAGATEGYTYCYYSCGEAATTWMDECCGTTYQCSNGEWGYALSWDWRGRPIYCEI